MTFQEWWSSQVEFDGEGHATYKPSREAVWEASQREALRASQGGGALVDVVMPFCFNTVLNGQSGNHYQRCRSCDGTTLDGDLDTNHVQHAIDCRLQAALTAAAQPQPALVDDVPFRSVAWELHKFLQRKGFVIGVENVPAIADIIREMTGDDKDERIPMVHPSHPCYGVDLWMCREIDIEHAKGQGYIPFDEYASPAPLPDDVRAVVDVAIAWRRATGNRKIDFIAMAEADYELSSAVDAHLAAVTALREKGGE